jgi:hypothetical protein
MLRVTIVRILKRPLHRNLSNKSTDFVVIKDSRSEAGQAENATSNLLNFWSSYEHPIGKWKLKTA